MQRLCFITESFVCMLSPVDASREFEKFQIYIQKHCPLVYLKMCSRICIYIYLSCTKTLDQKAEKRSSNLHESQLVEMCSSTD